MHMMQRQQYTQVSYTIDHNRQTIWLNKDAVKAIVHFENYIRRNKFPSTPESLIKFASNLAYCIIFVGNLVN
jgi:hypothetical protein